MTTNIVQCRCGARFAAVPRLAGQVVSCPTCRQPLVIPASRASAASRRTLLRLTVFAFGGCMLLGMIYVPLAFVAILMQRQALDGIARVQKENPPWMKPQDTLAIEYSIDDRLPNRDDFAERLATHFQRMVDERGLIIAPDARCCSAIDRSPWRST